MIRKFTTPTHTLTVKGTDLTEADVYVTYEQGDIKQTYTDVTCTLSGSDTVITVEMTQEETSKFKVGAYVEVQVNWVKNGKRDATDIKSIKVDGNLLDEVIS